VSIPKGWVKVAPKRARLPIGKHEIREIAEWDIAPYRKAAEKEGLDFTEALTFFGLYSEGDLAGFLGLKLTGVARMKCIYTVPAYRWRGVYSLLFSHACVFVKHLGYKKLVGNFMEVSSQVALKNPRARLIKRYGNGICKIEYPL